MSHKVTLLSDFWELGLRKCTRLKKKKSHATCTVAKPARDKRTSQGRQDKTGSSTAELHSSRICGKGN